MSKSAINIDQVSSRIKTETQVYEKLTKIYTKIEEAEKKTSNIRAECFKNFEDMEKISENDNKILKELYKNFGKIMKDLENNRKTYLDKINTLIIPVTQYYPTLLKQNKANLEEVSKSKKKREDLQKSSASGPDLRASQREEDSKADIFSKEFLKYENTRIKDDKFLILNFIHSELKYHCEVLQKLSELFISTKNKDVRVGLKKFGDDYGIKNFNYSKLNIDIDEIQKEVKKEEDEESEKINDVYLSKNKSQNKNVDDDEFEDSFDKKRKESRKTKDSRIGKSQMTEMDDNAKSRNIDDDD